MSCNSGGVKLSHPDPPVLIRSNLKFVLEDPQTRMEPPIFLFLNSSWAGFLGLRVSV